MSQLKQYYLKEVVSKLTETFKYKNIMQVPKLEKVVLTGDYTGQEIDCSI